MNDIEPRNFSQKYMEAVEQVGRWVFAGVIAGLVVKVLEYPATPLGGVLAAISILLITTLMALLLVLYREGEDSLIRECPSCGIEYEIRDFQDLERHETHILGCMNELTETRLGELDNDG